MSSKPTIKVEKPDDMDTVTLEDMLGKAVSPAEIKSKLQTLEGYLKKLEARIVRRQAEFVSEIQGSPNELELLQRGLQLLNLNKSGEVS